MSAHEREILNTIKTRSKLIWYLYISYQPYRVDMELIWYLYISYGNHIGFIWTDI